MKKLIKKFIDWLFEPDEYYGVTRFDAITAFVCICGGFMLVAFLIKSFC